MTTITIPLTCRDVKLILMTTIIGVFGIGMVFDVLIMAALGAVAFLILGWILLLTWLLTTDFRIKCRCDENV